MSGIQNSGSFRSSGSFRLRSNSFEANVSGTFNVRIPAAAGPASNLATNLRMSGQLRAGYNNKHVTVTGERVKDELEAFRRIYDAACADADDSAFVVNDTLQAAAELSAATFNGPEKEKRQTVLRKIISEHSDVTLALARGDRSALEAKGWHPFSEDPKALTYVNRREGLLLHMWNSHRHARRLATRSSRLSQALLEHRLQPMAVPVTILYLTRSFTFTFSPLVPVPTTPSDVKAVNAKHHADLNAGADAIGSVLGFMKPPGDDADLDEIRNLSQRRPEVNASIESLDIRVGRDGRVYIMNPSTVGIDLLRAAVTGSFAADAVLEATPTVSPECYHVAYPTGLTDPDTNGAKAAVNAITGVSVGHVVQAVVKRASDLAKAAGGNMKLMDLLTNDILGTAMRQHGVNRCFFNTLRNACKANTTPFAATLAELCEAEMIFRSLKVVFRSEALVAADRSDKALLKTFSDIFGLFTSGDDGMVLLLQSIVAAKFDIGEGEFVIDPKNVKLGKLVLFYLNAKAGLTFDVKEGRFVKFNAGGIIVSTAPTHPDLVKLAQKVPDGAAATYQMQMAVWNRIAATEAVREKCLRLSRLALLGYWAKPLKPEPAYEQLMKLPATSWTLDEDNTRETVSVGASTLCLSQLNDVVRPATHKAMQEMANALAEASSTPGLFMGWRLRQAQKPAGFAAYVASCGTAFGTSRSLCDGACAAMKTASDDVSSSASFLAITYASLAVAVKQLPTVDNSVAHLFRLSARACVDAIVTETTTMQRANVSVAQLPEPFRTSASDTRTCAEIITGAALYAHNEAIGRCSDVLNDVEVAVTAVRLATACAVSTQSRHASVMALLEYAAFVNDSVPSSTALAMSDPPAKQWEAWYTPKHVDEVRDTVETKAFATAIGGFVLDVLIPAKMLLEASAITRAMERCPRLFTAANSAPKFKEALDQLNKCNEAASRIQGAIMPVAVRRPKSKATETMKQRWPKSTNVAATPAALEAQALLYFSGLRAMEGTAWISLRVIELNACVATTKADIARTEDREWSTAHTEFMLQAGAAALDSVLAAESNGRADRVSVEHQEAFGIFRDAIEAIAEAQARDAFARLWSEPLVREHLTMSAGAATYTVESDEQNARSAITAESSELQLGMCLEALLVLSETTMRDAFEREWNGPLKAQHLAVAAGEQMRAVEMNESEARDELLRCELEVVAVAVLNGISDIAEAEFDFISASANSGAALHAVLRREEEARAQAWHQYLEETAEIVSSDDETVSRTHLWDTAVTAFTALAAEALLDSAARFGDAGLQASQGIITDAVVGAVDIAVRTVRNAEAQQRSSITVEYFTVYAAFVERAEKHARGFGAGEERVVRRTVERAEATSRVAEIPEVEARNALNAEEMTARCLMLVEAADIGASAILAEAHRELLRICEASEESRRDQLHELAVSTVVTAVAAAFDEDMTRDVRIREAAGRVDLSSRGMLEHQAVCGRVALQDALAIFVDFAVAAHEQALGDAAGILDVQRVKLHNKGIRKLLKNVETTDEPKARHDIDGVKLIRAKSALCLAGHTSLRTACFADFLAALSRTTVRQERSRRAKLVFELTDTFHSDGWIELEAGSRKVIGKEERRTRASLRRHLSVLEEEATERRSIAEQSEKMYRDVSKVMNIMVSAMAAGPRATLLRPSERVLLHRKEEVAMSHSPAKTRPGEMDASDIASPSPHSPPRQRHLPLGAVVLQDPVLKQQAGLLFDMAKMRADELTEHAATASAALHKKWAGSPYDDHHGGRGGVTISFSENTSGAMGPEPLSPRSFTNAITSLVATEMWKRVQITQIHADFISSCRIEFREVDTLLRGEKRAIPRTTLILSLPLASPLYFTCFRELTRKMTKTPEERAREKRRVSGPAASSRHELSSSNVGAHSVSKRAASSKRLSIASSVGTSFSVNSSTGFDALQRNVLLMKKLFVACDRGVTALYTEEDHKWTKLLAQERFGRVNLSDMQSLRAAIQAQHTSVLPADPTAAPALALPVVRLTNVADIRLIEAEHRMAVAMAEAEHRFELLQRLNREAPASHKRGPSVLTGTAPVPHYLNARFIRDVTQKRRAPHRLEASPQRSVAGSPPAGAGGYSFSKSVASSHSPVKAAPARRKLAPLARSASMSPQSSKHQEVLERDTSFASSTPDPVQRRRSLPPLNQE